MTNETPRMEVGSNALCSLLRNTAWNEDPPISHELFNACLRMLTDSRQVKQSFDLTTGYVIIRPAGGPYAPATMDFVVANLQNVGYTGARWDTNVTTATKIEQTILIPVPE